MDVELTEDLFNFAGTPYGGLLFSLADDAFAVASNSRGRVALPTHVSGRGGERAYAEGKVSHLIRRAGFYDMTVTTEPAGL